MLRVKRFVNKLMNSNCYVVSEEGYRSCIVIDPGTEDCQEIIEYFETQNIDPGYIYLTHEHSDHTWGSNTLIDKYNSKVVASEGCKKALPKENSAYFQFYFDDPNYTYSVKRVDIIIDVISNIIEWNNHKVEFLLTPGHTDNSVCISIDNILFTGDTVMQCKPFIFKRCSKKEILNSTINNIVNLFPSNTIVCPGHGEQFLLHEL